MAKGIEKFPDLDEQELVTYILNKVTDDLSDRDEFGFNSKLVYDINAYEGKKRPTTFPWINASNFPVPLTPTLLDTAQANIVGSMFANPNQIVSIKPIGIEDKQNSKYVESLLNWQLLDDIKIFTHIDQWVHCGLKHGRSTIKLIPNPETGSLSVEIIPIENMIYPVDTKGYQGNETDHVFQEVLLDDNDMEDRKVMGVYDNIDDIPKGRKLINTSERLQQARDAISGRGVNTRRNRDYYYLLECYLTYYYTPKGEKGGKAPKKKVELICTVAPASKMLLRIAENPLVDENGNAVRPFVELIPYDERSLPEIVRKIQEELDYAHNQNINAADKAISPPGFYPSNGDFDPELNQLVPGGFYPAPNPRDIVFQEINVNPIFERQEDRYWDLAERLTGLTELFQAVQPDSSSTLGEAVLRNNRAEIRFARLYKQVEVGFKKLISLIYFYDQKFLRDDVKVKILGTSDIQSMSEIFPDGIQGKYDYSFSSKPITETQIDRDNAIAFYLNMKDNPIVAANEANLYRVSKVYADAMGQNNFESLVSKPKSADTLTAEEAINLIMSGRREILPDPAIDAERYIFKIQMHMRSQSFQLADDEMKTAFVKLLVYAMSIREGQIDALTDVRIIQEFARSSGQQAQIPSGQSQNTKQARTAA